MSTTQDPPEDTDKQYYEAEMQSVTPLNAPHKPKTPRPQTVLDPTVEQDSDFTWRYDEMAHPIDPDASIQFARNGVQLKPLKSTHHPPDIEASLDLHRMNRDQAATALHHFLNTAQTHNQRILHIIHGKGQHGTLKTALIHWLKHHPAILGFCTALPHQGGTGALYALVKQRNTR